jgi:protein ImuB
VLYDQPRRGVFRVVAYAGSRPILPGMTLAEATACGAGFFEEHAPQRDAAALAQLALACEPFSPGVGLLPPDSLSLDVTGVAPLFGSEELLVEHLFGDFRERGLTIRVALADTLGLAWGVAHFQTERFTIVPPGETAATLRELPLGALRISAATIQLLEELGIDQVGGLLDLPRAALASRFEPDLLIRLDQARGALPELIPAHRPLPEIVVEQSLEYPLAHGPSLQTCLAQLLEQAAAQLAQRQQGAVQLECRLDCEQGSPVVIKVDLYRATADCEHLFEMLQLRLEHMALSAPVVRLALAVLLAAPLIPWQRELFAAGSLQTGQRQLTRLIDRLSNRLGSQAVVRARLQPEAQPEFSFRREPWAGIARAVAGARWPASSSKKSPAAKRNANRNFTTRNRSRSARKLRPLSWESTPLPLEVRAAPPSSLPQQIYWQGEWLAVQRVWGPERIQTGWWRGRDIQRDYFRVETAGGARLWIFRRWRDGHWFLHGLFA